MNHTFLLILLLFFQFLSVETLNATTIATELPSFLEHLELSEVENIELHLDLGALLSREPENDDYQDATLVYTDKNDQLFEWNLGVKPRGKYRRRICDFPPLKLNFSKKELQAKGLANFDKYKLVTHCDDDRMTSKEAVIREYLTYQLYQALSQESFKVQLLRIRYVDSRGEQSSFYRYAILIESTEELGARLSAEECEDCYVSHPAVLDAAAENKLAVFQYMIGNTDFSVAQRRNLKFFTPNNGDALIPVGYDFDFAAIVDAPYAIPTRHLGQQKLTDRVYLGYAIADDLMESTLALFESKRTIFLTIISQEKRLSLSARVEMKNYLNSFFVTLNTLKLSNGNKRTYTQMRQTAPQVVPDGGHPAHYGVSK